MIEQKQNETAQSSILVSVERYAQPGENLLHLAQDSLIAEAMHRAGGVQARAAKILGLSPRMVNYYVTGKHST